MPVSLPPHNILSPFHLDTLVDTVVRGDILYGNSTPKWARLPKPSVLSGLSHDGTDVSWVTATGTGAPVMAVGPALTGPITLAGVVGSSAAVITGATQTASFPALSITQTWNNGAVSFTGVKINCTSSASAATSYPLDVQVGGASIFRVRKDEIQCNQIETISGSLTVYNTGGNLCFTTVNGGISLNNIAAAVGDKANVIAQRNGSIAQSLRIYNTFTTLDTAGEWFKIDWRTTANQLRFGAVNGSSSGTARVASWDYGGTEASPVAAISVPITSGNVTFGGGITLPGGATFLTTNTALTDGGGASAGTLANAPSVGNPTKWIGINDNGTTRYIPAW